MRTWKNMQGLKSMRPMYARMRGLTLIELMISVVLGLGVMGGILALYVNVNETASYLNAASRVQENGRFATDQIVRTMRMAGYDDPVTTGTARPTLVLEGKSSTSLSMSGFILRGAVEAVQIAYEGAPLVRDCLGVQVPADTWVTNTYAISTEDELVCNTVTLTGGTAVTSAGQVIAEGVEGMQLLYGVDTDADGVANRYHVAGSVSDWTTVVSAKIALLVNSVEPVFATTQHSCESCSMFNPTANRLMRGEFNATVQFRNALGT